MNSPTAWSFNPAGKNASQPQGPDPLADTGPERVEHQVQPPPLRAYSGSLVLLALGLSGIGCAISALLGRIPSGTLGTGVLGAVYGVLGLTLCALSVPGWKRRSGSRGTLTLDREALILTRGGEQLRFPLQALEFAVADRPVLFGGTLRLLRLRAPEAQARVEQFTPKYEESGLDALLASTASRLEDFIYGTPLEALCGMVFVPQRDPTKLPMCAACKDIYETYRIFNEGLPEGPAS